MVFKTLVTAGTKGRHYVFMVPVAEELDLKKAAAAVGEKSVEMVKSRELFPLTGYVHGGCSPVGMKTRFRTVIDETAGLHERILFSGGRIGCQVEMKPGDLMGLVGAGVAELT
jgi:Cys-tRNA(Pro)/Cys-tRNA(Cys) deacylase